MSKITVWTTIRYDSNALPCHFCALSHVASDHHCDQGTPAAPHEVVLHLSKNLANFTANVCVQIIDCEWVVGKNPILEVPSQEEVRKVEIRWVRGPGRWASRKEPAEMYCDTQKAFCCGVHTIVNLWDRKMKLGSHSSHVLGNNIWKRQKNRAVSFWVIAKSEGNICG